MRTPDFSDEQLVAGLRTAAGELGEPLTSTVYDRWQRGRDDAASAALVIRRLGGWVEACTRAGLSTNKTRSTSRRWTDGEVVAIVAAYLRTPGSSGTFAGYADWAREQSGVPSGSTLRQRFPRWAELKERAQEGP